MVCSGTAGEAWNVQVEQGRHGKVWHGSVRCVEVSSGLVVHGLAGMVSLGESGKGEFLSGMVRQVLAGMALIPKYQQKGETYGLQMENSGLFKSVGAGCR